MSKKTEIKVYLPTKMVGELESKKKLGVRSKFIAQAIRSRLDKSSEFDIWDISDDEIINEAIVRCRRDNDLIMSFLRRVFQ